MLISDLCKKLPGKILSQRTVKDDIGTPKRISFLIAPTQMRDDVLYIASAAEGENYLPFCTAPNGSTIVCAGNIPVSLQCQVNINIISVDCKLLELYNPMSEYLSQCQQYTDIEAERLRRKFASIVEMNMPGEYSVDNVCATFPKRIKSSYCIICIESHESEGRSIRDHSMRKELQELFAGDNITLYDNNTIIIHSYDGFTHPPKLPVDELSELLKKYQAIAGISNGMRKLSEMRLMYILAKKSLESGKALFGSTKNVFFYDDSMMFSIVSFVAHSFQTQNSSDDIVLLGNPILSAIYKHDPQDKKQLVETLIQYIINGCSTSRTADTMHMHRNTVKNRITLIEQISGTSIAQNGMLQSKLLITYYIIQYYTKVMHKKMMFSPLQPEYDNIIQSKPADEKTE